MEEAMELIYRIQTDHGGRLTESEARERLGGWAANTARRAERLSWLVAKGSPAVLVGTYRGRKALDAALASKNALPPPHWLGGFISLVQSPTGTVLPAPPVLAGMKEKCFSQGRMSREIGLSHKTVKKCLKRLQTSARGPA